MLIHEIFIKIQELKNAMNAYMQFLDENALKAKNDQFKDGNEKPVYTKKELEEKLNYWVQTSLNRFIFPKETHAWFTPEYNEFLECDKNYAILNFGGVFLSTFFLWRADKNESALRTQCRRHQANIVLIFENLVTTLLGMPAYQMPKYKDYENSAMTALLSEINVFEIDSEKTFKDKICDRIQSYQQDLQKKKERSADIQKQLTNRNKELTDLYNKNIDKEVLWQAISVPGIAILLFTVPGALLCALPAGLTTVPVGLALGVGIFLLLCSAIIIAFSVEALVLKDSTVRSDVLRKYEPLSSFCARNNNTLKFYKLESEKECADRSIINLNRRISFLQQKLNDEKPAISIDTQALTSDEKQHTAASNSNSFFAPEKTSAKNAEAEAELTAAIVL